MQFVHTTTIHFHQAQSALPLFVCHSEQACVHSSMTATDKVAAAF